MRPHTLIALGFAVLAATCHADTYKCTTGGKTVYSDVPCASNAKSVSAAEDTVTAAQQREALLRRRDDQALVQSYEMRDRRYEREKAASAAAFDEERRRKKAKCDGYLQAAERARNQASTYRYHQGLIDSARRREKEANDRHFSECYGQGNY